jgi:hypothetical protein
MIGNTALTPYLACRLFLWAGPLELMIVLVMVSRELGFLPALAGVSATLALIPMQARKHVETVAVAGPPHPLIKCKSITWPTGWPVPEVYAHDDDDDDEKNSI